ncbi:hypothetical protein [Neobacillus sp. PS2-9]|uniref:hypothetical protein n=1 Tax=Neobacillus sp. PS2-9 TaxID=3070676 RepID=UPI0027E06BB6|nr:hypothetical protein [Neobacillus sp. PS2-9]WML57954.1 hypothetical protein RCG25_24250 [Neobacillus sp. PS2-9]
MSFIKPMKDKTEENTQRTVLHKADEGQNRREYEKNVLHKADEGQNRREYEKNWRTSIVLCKWLYFPNKEMIIYAKL